jgi:hypothetical protein
MNPLDTLAVVSLPDLIRTRATGHLERLSCAEDVLVLRLAMERAEGFVEGLEASRALTLATVEALYIAFENVGESRRLELKP